MIGLHIISDLKGVDFENLDLDEKKLKKIIIDGLGEVGLTTLGSFFHTFGNDNEITGVVALAESHISIHTWPEKSYISLDIFVCNFGDNNSNKAKKLYKKLIEFLKPSEVEEKFISRDN